MPEIQETVRVRAPREQVYDMWCDPDTFVAIVGGLEEADREGRTLKWEASGPLGLTMHGEAEITQEQRPDRIAWNTIEGALDAHGSIEFEQDGDETLVAYALRYDVPGGAAGKAVAGMTDAEKHVRETLERFKRLAEERTAEG
jgi:uncharacterized membrane protein